MVWRHVQKVIGGLDVEIVWKCFSKSHCEYVELLVNGKREQGMPISGKRAGNIGV